MSLTISHALLISTTSNCLESSRTKASRYADDAEREHLIEPSVVDSEGLRELVSLATDAKEMKLARAATAILEAREGKFDKAIPNFGAFEGMLNAFLRSSLIDGWIYVEGRDGELYPELVTSVRFVDHSHARGAKRPNEVVIYTQFYGPAGRKEGSLESAHSSHTFTPEMVTRRKISDVFADTGFSGRLLP
ncbi:hypothetical protein [Acidovorax sp.]|uniref:hypothetical protein n=1 Tax=Acidovorax sp. TaxID=1872122 RepID=UPI00391F027C